MTRRTDQINDLLRSELSDLLREEVNDPRMHGLVTITRVDVSPDLRQARAYVSVLGTDEDRRSTMQALESARPFLRRELGARRAGRLPRRGRRPPARLGERPRRVSRPGPRR